MWCALYLCNIVYDDVKGKITSAVHEVIKNFKYVSLILFVYNDQSFYLKYTD
jgi:hypothetical protein